jgi:hypothetical protein
MFRSGSFTEEKTRPAPIADSEDLVHAIEAAGGRSRFTRLADRDHFNLDVYVKNEVFDWMLEPFAVNARWIGRSPDYGNLLVLRADIS